MQLGTLFVRLRNYQQHHKDKLRNPPPSASSFPQPPISLSFHSSLYNQHKNLPSNPIYALFQLQKRFLSNDRTDIFRTGDIRRVAPPPRTEPRQISNKYEPSHTVPISKEFPGIPKVVYKIGGTTSTKNANGEQVLEKPTTKMTTLPNGIRVASQETFKPVRN